MEASALTHPVGLGRLSVSGRLLRLRSDEQLVALFREGHEDAFGVIHDRYRQRLFAYSRQMLSGSSADAEDVTQDVFLRAYNALRVDARPVSLRAWLYRVAHNRCIDQVRRPVPAAADIFDLNRAPQHDPTAEAERRDDLRRLIADVRRLPEQQRSALLMREMEGLSYNELADALGVTVPAIKSLLVRARIGLVEAIEARDTACVDIRADMASAFDRGVRASGRTRRHLRECHGCRDYRDAMRGMEKQLQALAPGGHGPLATFAKLLGLGGAGSGAAAGAGGGGAAATGGAVTISGGAAATATVTATATKVVAVVAAAAVVGGGAAKVEQRVEQRAAPATPAVVLHSAPAAASVVHDAQRLRDLRVVRAPATPAGEAGPTAAAPSVAELTVDNTDPPMASSGSTGAAALEPGTGGLQAPDEPLTDDAVQPGTGLATEVTGSGPATTGASGTTGSSMPGTTGSTAGATGPTTPASTGTAPATGTPASGTGTAGPTGQSTGGSAPIAQGATASEPPAQASASGTGAAAAQ